jgi:hypothetical protein
VQSEINVCGDALPRLIGALDRQSDRLNELLGPRKSRRKTLRPALVDPPGVANNKYS